MQTINLDNKIIATVNLASKYHSISRAGVFGSYARGEQTKTSDIDILFEYISTDDDSFLDDIDNYFEDLETNLGKIDFIPYNGLSNSSETIRNLILNDVIWIYEKNSHADEL